MKLSLRYLKGGLAERYRKAAKKVPEVIEDALKKDIGNEILRELYGLVTGWDHEVEFEMQVTPNRYVQIITEDPAFGYLDAGTRVRRALMSDDFEPKTTVGSFRSGPGAGRLVFVSWKLDLPGIRARKWTQALRTKYQPKLVKAVRARLKKLMESEAPGI